MEGVGEVTFRGVALEMAASSGLVSRVVPDVNEGVAPSEAITHGLRFDSCANDLKASPKGVNNSSGASTVGGVFPTSETRFLRFEMDLESEGRGAKLSKGRMISWLGARASASTIANMSSGALDVPGLLEASSAAGGWGDAVASIVDWLSGTTDNLLAI